LTLSQQTHRHAGEDAHSTLVEKLQAKHNGKPVGASCTMVGTKQLAQRAYKLKGQNKCPNPHWQQSTQVEPGLYKCRESTSNKANSNTKMFTWI